MCLLLIIHYYCNGRFHLSQIRAWQYVTGVTTTFTKYIHTSTSANGNGMFAYGKSRGAVGVDMKTLRALQGTREKEKRRAQVYEIRCYDFLFFFIFRVL